LSSLCDVISYANIYPLSILDILAIIDTSASALSPSASVSIVITDQLLASLSTTMLP